MSATSNANGLPAAAHAPLKADLPWHRLGDHLLQVGVLAADRIKTVIDPTWGKLAGIWHDLGKFAPDWQDFIRAAGESSAAQAHVEEDDEDHEPQKVRRARGPDHSTAGAIHAVKMLGKDLGAPLAFAISGHHGGMPDQENLRERIVNEEKGRRHASSVGHKEAEGVAGDVSRPALPPWISTLPALDRRRSLELFTRILFSALVDADFLDTEAYFSTAGHDRAQFSVEARARGWPALSAYRGELDLHLDAKTRNAPNNAVNRLRAAVLTACRDAATRSPAIFTLTVPTGGGKTLASLAFALDHAARHAKRRVIVALPFTSIIEQTAQVFGGVFSALGADVVLEHHSALDPRRATALGRVSSENWDAPLIVTTQVQLFESLFANRPAACRKLHSLIGSVLILDEVQSLPAGLLAPILDVIDELAANYGVTVVLTTATQPAFHRRDLGGTIFPGLKREPTEIIPAGLVSTIWEGLRRVRVHWPVRTIPASQPHAASFWDHLGTRIGAHQQVLAITHLKQDAQDLWQVVSRGDPGALHLSAAMCPAHRTSVLGEVKRRLETKETCRLVTTQVVEAGVDIDFPVVFRAMAGLESLAQSAGRCNREGRLECGEFFVFQAPTRPPRSLQLHQDVALQMLDSQPDLDLFSSEVFRGYFDRLYSQKDCDLHGIQRLRDTLKFKETASSFRMIGDQTVPVFVPYEDRARELIVRLRFGGPSSGALRPLQRYAVSVYPKQFDSLRAEGAIEEVGPESGFWALCSDIHYHPALGLRTTADSSVALII